jgi:hypothetical protein
MAWLNNFLWYIGAAALLSAGGCFLLQRIWHRRFLALQREVAQFSEDLFQMVDLQMDIYRRVCRNLNDIEEKVLDLSVPSSNGPLPLERRHQVMTLARKGVDPEEIARRLNMPKGEVELIMSLRKYVDMKTSGERGQGGVKDYARTSS